MHQVARPELAQAGGELAQQRARGHLGDALVAPDVLGQVAPGAVLHHQVHAVALLVTGAPHIEAQHRFVPVVRQNDCLYFVCFCHQQQDLLLGPLRSSTRCMGPRKLRHSYRLAQARLFCVEEPSMATCIKGCRCQGCRAEEGVICLRLHNAPKCNGQATEAAQGRAGQPRRQSDDSQRTS